MTNHTRRTSNDRTTRRCAFTLVEMLVVIVVLAVLAGLITPKLRSGRERAAETQAQRVRQLVAAAYRRNALNAERLAVEFNHEGRTLTILRIGEVKGRRAWVDDNFTTKATLDQLDIDRVMIDGFRNRDESWFLELPMTGPRPSVAITVSPHGANDGERSWRIDGSTEVAGASLTRADGDRKDPAPTVRDLDLSGRGEDPW